MYRFILILCCISVGFAQEARFFEIPIAETVTYAVAASGGGPLVEVFYNTASGAYHLTYDSDAQAVVGPITDLNMGPRPRVMTAEILTNGDWTCVVSTCEDCDIYPRIHGAWIVRGNGMEIFEGNRFYEEDETPTQYDCCGALQGPRIAVRPNGDYSVTGVSPGRWGVESTADLVLFPYVYEYLYVGDHFMNVFPQYIDDDTLDILSAASLGGVVRQRVAVECEFDCAPDATFWPYSMEPSLMLLTHGQRFLMLWQEYLFAMQPDSTRDTLAVLDQELGWSEPIADVHPDYGFAYVLADGQSMMLHRVDTLGISPAESGTVAWNVQAFSTSVNFGTSGELLVAYSASGASEGTIGLTVVPWTAPLASPGPPIQAPKAFQLRAFPNPFNSSIQINYDLPQTADVRLSIFNTLGQEIATLVNGRAEAGTHSQTWSPTGASGVYFVKLVAGELVTSQKILYIR